MASCHAGNVFSVNKNGRLCTPQYAAGKFINKLTRFFQPHQLVNQLIYLLFLAAAFFFAAVGVTGRLLPNEPLKRFPLAVFLSPLPMVIYFSYYI